MKQFFVNLWKFITMERCCVCGNYTKWTHAQNPICDNCVRLIKGLERPHVPTAYDRHKDESI